MNFQKYLSTFQGLKTENRFNRIVTIALIAAVVLEGAFLAQRPQIVTIQPWTLAQDAQITKSDASENYIEAWGLALSEMLGNVQPGNVDFIAERLGPLLDPAIYHRVLEELQRNAEDLRQDRVTLRFEPRTVNFERSTGLVFVSGYSYVRQGTGLDPEVRSKRTFEFGIKIAHYAPVITHIDTYEGDPRTVDRIRRDEKHEEMVQKRRKDYEERTSGRVEKRANLMSEDSDKTIQP